MDVEPLTADEKKWLKQFQALMDKCPSKRLGAFTTGDACITVYDKTVFDFKRFCLPYERDAKDDVTMHDDWNTVLGTINMPFQVDGVCG